jgi:hypothetical protein
MRFVISLVTFDSYKRFYNPSRVNPVYITHLVGSMSKQDKVLLATTNNASEVGVALSVVTVKDSYLHKPESWSNGRCCKSFSGKLLQQEDTLWMSGLLMSFGLAEATGPIHAGWVSFTCRPAASGDIQVILSRTLFIFFFCVCDGWSIDTKLSPSKSRTTSTVDIKPSIGSESNRMFLP